MAENTLRLLCSSAKLDRDRGVDVLIGFLNDLNTNEALSNIKDSILTLANKHDVPWETKHGSLLGIKTIIQNQNARSLETKSEADDFVQKALQCAMIMIEDEESRVRLASGEVMGALCEKNGSEIYENTKSVILEGVRTNLERQPLSDSDLSQESMEKLTEKLGGNTSPSHASDGRRSPLAEKIFHDTAGWRSLETWMKCLQLMIDGCGPSFNSHVDQNLLDLIFSALGHTNRFVRETGYYVCGSLVNCNVREGASTPSIDENAIYLHGEQFSKQLATGLADNWSQVRLASSVATRHFLIGLPEENRHLFYAKLLPPLCLNRYYVAEGVRIYNQKTWELAMGNAGKALVEQYIKEVVDFYVSQSEADNHAVREAACACIAELCTKIDQDTVRPYVAKLLDALLVCFHDESWPVRDASCVACGNFILCFPEESKSSMMELYKLFFENLQDPIASVRQGAAQALANVVKAYGEESFNQVFAKCKTGLEGVKNQEANTEKFSSLEKGPGNYGVIKHAMANDMERHTNQQMYSCGSLAPKMHRGKRGGGCMDHQFRKPSEPWELADGCVCLMSTLSHIPEVSIKVCQQLHLLAKAAEYHHYAQHVYLLETLCTKLPRIAEGVGKKGFKRYLEMFFEPIFYSLSCDNTLTSSAATQCLQELSVFVGPNILRGRVEGYDMRYLKQYDSLHLVSGNIMISGIRQSPSDSIGISSGSFLPSSKLAPGIFPAGAPGRLPPH